MRIGIRGRLAGVALGLLVGLACVLDVSAAHLETIDALVVKYRDDALAPDAGALPDYEMYALAASLRSGFALTGRTRDGGYRITLNPPLPVDEARAAVNRVRMDAGILYVSLAPNAPAGKPGTQLKSASPG